LQDKDKMIERMGAFMVSKGFDVLPLAQQQELAQTLVDHIQGIPGSGQSSEARVARGGLTPAQHMEANQAAKDAGETTYTINGQQFRVQ